MPLKQNVKSYLVELGFRSRHRTLHRIRHIERDRRIAIYRKLWSGIVRIAGRVISVIHLDGINGGRIKVDFAGCGDGVAAVYLGREFEFELILSRFGQTPELIYECVPMDMIFFELRTGRLSLRAALGPGNKVGLMALCVAAIYGKWFGRFIAAFFWHGAIKHNKLIPSLLVILTGNLHNNRLSTND